MNGRAFFALCAIISVAFGSGEDELVVQVANGKVRGVKQVGYEGNTVHSFMSIPYAKPPVGPLRFRSPEPAEDWDGILDATKYGPPCMQPKFGDMINMDLDEETVKYFQKEDMDEDCLTLDVHVPANSKTTKPMAVMVWVHGGGFGLGYGQLANGENAAANYTLLRGDVILVGMNYRLGPFGFLSTGDENALGNWGLRDQSLALAWVKTNIAAFGGDPQRVTIFGISAGGMSVNALLMSPYANTLFNRVIAQSGVISNVMTNLNPLSDAKRLARRFNCSDAQTDKLVECLRQIPAPTLLDYSKVDIQTAEDFIAYEFFPVIDGDFFPKGPPLIERNVADKDMIVGFADMEGLSFPGNLMLKNPPEDYMTVRPSISRSDFDQAVSQFTYIHMPKSFGSDQCILDKIAEAIKYAYTDWDHVNDGYKRFYMVAKLSGDYIFNFQAFKVAKNRDSSNGTASTYVYLLKHKSLEEKVKKFLFYAPKWLDKATHGEDMYYMFAPFLSSYNKQDRKVSEDIVTYWTNFARTGNPNEPFLRPGMDRWEAYSTVSEKYLEIGENSAIKADLDPKFVNFWMEYIPKLVEGADCKTENRDNFTITYLRDNIIYILIATPLALVIVKYFTHL